MGKILQNGISYGGGKGGGSSKPEFAYKMVANRITCNANSGGNTIFTSAQIAMAGYTPLTVSLISWGSGVNSGDMALCGFSYDESDETLLISYRNMTSQSITVTLGVKMLYVKN